MAVTSAPSAIEPGMVALDPRTGDGSHPQLHAPRAGETASLLVDYRELFKLRVTLMVTLTGFAGFYLGSMRSGITSLQPGLLKTLIGICVVSSGAAALNQAIERKLDAKMLRTENRPMATGRIGLAHGIAVGLLAIIAGTLWLTLEDECHHRRSDSAHRVPLCCPLHAAEALHYRWLPLSARSPEPCRRCWAGPRRAA